MADRGDATPFDYAAVGAADVRDGVDGAIRRVERIVGDLSSVADGARSFANTLQPLEEIDNLLGEAGGRYAFLAQVSPDEAVRSQAHASEQQLDTFATTLGFREEIYAALKAFAGSAEAESLDAVAARLLERQLRDFRRNGMDLEPDRRAQVQASQERLVALGVQFRRQIDEYEDALLLTREQLAGLPDSYIERLRSEERDGRTRYRVSLDYPELFPFLESADDPALREALFRKNHNKAAGQNVAVLEEALALRDEIATTLGYRAWSDYTLEIRMAKTPQAALDFLADLEGKVRRKAAADMGTLTASQREHGGDGETLAIWDWRYETQRVLREQHQVDPFEVAEYFPLEAVLEGLFDAYQRLVGVQFVPRESLTAWHADVRYFDIVDQRADDVVGHFYMDLHPRPDKFGHAAAFTLRGGRALPEGGYQAPVSAIVANFTKPAPNSPSLLRHSEVVTLFHEFGHILHQTLTRSRYLRFSGTRVERDFVEAPSQMLEHWCWAPEVLRGFARHHRSGDPLPEDLLGRMVAAKNVSSGIAALRQIYFSRLDLAYHGPGAKKDTDAIARELHGITGFLFPEGTHFQAGFGHLFGYDAGYYGYLWSKVYGDDMFTRFDAAGLDDAAVGRAYREGILERGGSVDGAVLIRDFLGREPTPDAFLRELGLDGAP